MSLLKESKADALSWTESGLCWRYRRASVPMYRQGLMWLDSPTSSKGRTIGLSYQCFTMCGTRKRGIDEAQNLSTIKHPKNVVIILQFPNLVCTMTLSVRIVVHREEHQGLARLRYLLRSPRQQHYNQSLLS